MNHPDPRPEDTPDAEPRFDVRARRVGDQPLDDLRRRLVEEARITPEKADALVGALRSGPTVVLGRGVSRQRADKAQALSKAGLEIEVRPILTLAPKLEAEDDGRMVCPACGETAVMGPHRQCPHCGVYVDKVSPESQLRRRLEEQERTRLAWQLQHQQQAAAAESRAALERRLREEIRAELEDQHGLSRRPAWRDAIGQPRVAGAVAASVAVAFAAGWWLPRWVNPADAAPIAMARAAAPTPPRDLDALLARLDEFAPAAGQAASATAVVADADSLRPVGTAASGPQGAALDAALTKVDGLPALPAGVDWPADLLPRLRADLAVALARAGQPERAAEARQALEPWRSSTDPVLGAALRRARLLVGAWGLQDQASAAAAPRLAQLRQEMQGLVDPIERASTLAELVPVLARSPGVPEDVVMALLAQVGGAIKSVADDTDRRRLAEAWILSEAEALQAWAEREAATGHGSRLRGRAAALAALLPQAMEPTTQARLIALQARVAQLQGEPAQRLASAWPATLERSASLPQQAEALRALAAGGATEEVRRLATRLAARAETSDSSTRVQTLAQLSLLWAEAGQPEHQLPLRQRALQTPGLPMDTLLRLRGQLVAGGEIAQARAAQRAGDPARAEVHWRAVAAYLL